MPRNDSPNDFTAAFHAVLLTAVAEAVRPAVAEALADALPDVLRRAALPAYLTRKQVLDLTGWSPRKLAYLQAERRIAFVKRGRSVVFNATDIEAYLAEGYVPAKSVGAVGAGHTNGRAQGVSSPG